MARFKERTKEEGQQGPEVDAVVPQPAMSDEERARIESTVSDAYDQIMQSVGPEGLEEEIEELEEKIRRDQGNLPPRGDRISRLTRSIEEYVEENPDSIIAGYFETLEGDPTPYIVENFTWRSRGNTSRGNTLSISVGLNAENIGTVLNTDEYESVRDDIQESILTTMGCRYDSERTGEVIYFQGANRATIRRLAQLLQEEIGSRDAENVGEGHLPVEFEYGLRRTPGGMVPAISMRYLGEVDATREVGF